MQCVREASLQASPVRWQGELGIGFCRVVQTFCKQEAACGLPVDCSAAETFFLWVSSRSRFKEDSYFQPRNVMSYQLHCLSLELLPVSLHTHVITPVPLMVPDMCRDLCRAASCLLLIPAGCWRAALLHAQRQSAWASAALTTHVTAIATLGAALNA